MKKINEGYCAELFAGENGQLLKLYRPGWRQEDVVLEYESTKAVCSLSLPSPQVYSMEEREGRHGFWMELVSGQTMLERIQQTPFQALALARQDGRPPRPNAPDPGPGGPVSRPKGSLQPENSANLPG